jgi:hypothetical protein
MSTDKPNKSLAQLYGIWRNDKTPEHRRQFIKLRRKVTNVVRQAKRRSSKVLWKNLESIGVKDLLDANIISPAKLGSYYESLCSVTPPVTTHVMNKGTDESRFSFINVNAMEVHRAIYCITSNAVGLNEISLKFLKMILPIILPCVLHMFNNVLTGSSFSAEWRISKIVPIPKKSDPTKLDDYKPHSILPTLSKAMSCGTRWLVFVDNFSLLDCLQSGFRSQHVTTTAMLKVTSDFQFSCDRKLMNVLPLLDISKAFDHIFPSLLYSKLSSLFRFHGTAVKLIRSYLSDRY